MLIQKQYKLILLEIYKKNTTIFFIIEEANEIVWDFSKGTVKVLWF